MVTAESAAVLPVLCAVALALLWMVSVGIAQVRVVDAARDAARAVASGSPDRVAVAAAHRTAGADATVSIVHRDGLVVVTVIQRAAAPGWLPVPLPSVKIRAASEVDDESAARRG